LASFGLDISRKGDKLYFSYNKRMKKLISLILLIAISFSIAHGVVLDTHQDNHCSVQEFAEEFSHPIQHDIDDHDGDLCNTHFMLHISFLVPTSFSLLEVEQVEQIISGYLHLNDYHYQENTFRPPIG
jgi:hypothetical protein